MSPLEKAMLKRIDNLLKVGGHIDMQDIGRARGTSSDIGRHVYVGTVGIISSLYGPDSLQARAVSEVNSRIMNYKWSEQLKNGGLVLEMRGTLTTVKAEIEAGLIKSIRDEARGEILADFIVLAKDAIDKGVNDVAAVL